MVISGSNSPFLSYLTFLSNVSHFPKMSFISLSTSEALTYPKMYSYLYSEVFTEEFAHISFID